jgi:Yip1-like protein
LLSATIVVMTALATILAHPRQTIRSIVAQSRSSRVVVLLVLLATLSDLIRSIRWQLYRESPRFAAMMPSPWIICAGLIGILVGALLLFYAFAFLVMGIGRLLGGNADGRLVRLALAWSFAPLIWALLYRIPVALFQPATGATLDEPHSPLAVLHSAVAAMSLYALVSSAVIVLLTVVVDIWTFAIASVALSEVNGFSTWRGAATLGFALLAPLIVVAAFFISRAG